MGRAAPRLGGTDKACLVSPVGACSPPAAESRSWTARGSNARRPGDQGHLPPPGGQRTRGARPPMARFAASLLTASLVVSILGATAFTQTAQRPPWPLTPHGELAAKKERRESATRKKEHRKSAKKKGEPQEGAKNKQKRAECKEQAQKLLDDTDKRAYMKECISNL